MPCRFDGLSVCIRVSMLVGWLHVSPLKHSTGRCVPTYIVHIGSCGTWHGYWGRHEWLAMDLNPESRKFTLWKYINLTIPARNLADISQYRTEMCTSLFQRGYCEIWDMCFVGFVNWCYFYFQFNLLTVAITPYAHIVRTRLLLLIYLVWDGVIYKQFVPNNNSWVPPTNIEVRVRMGY